MVNRSHHPRSSRVEWRKRDASFALDHRMSWLVTATFLPPPPSPSSSSSSTFPDGSDADENESRNRRRRREKTCSPNHWCPRMWGILPIGLFGLAGCLRAWLVKNSEQLNQRFIDWSKLYLNMNDDRQSLSFSFSSITYWWFIYFLFSVQTSWFDSGFFSPLSPSPVLLDEEKKKNFASSKANKKEIGHHQIDRRHFSLSSIFFSRSGWFSPSRFSSRSLSLSLCLHCASIDVASCNTHTHTHSRSQNNPSLIPSSFVHFFASGVYCCHLIIIIIFVVVGCRTAAGERT